MRCPIIGFFRGQFGGFALLGHGNQISVILSLWGLLRIYICSAGQRQELLKIGFREGEGPGVVRGLKLCYIISQE